MKVLVCVLCLVPTFSWAIGLQCAKKISPEETLYTQVKQVAFPVKIEDGNINIELYKKLIRENAFPKEQGAELTHRYDVFKVETSEMMGGGVVYGGAERVDAKSEIMNYKNSSEQIEIQKQVLLSMIDKADRVFSYPDDPSRLYLNNKDGNGMTIDFRYPLFANPIAMHVERGTLRYMYVDPNGVAEYAKKSNAVLDSILQEKEFFNEECDDQVVGRMRTTKTPWGDIDHPYETIQMNSTSAK